MTKTYFWASLDAFEDRTALSHLDGRKCSYRDLAAQADRLAQPLEGRKKLVALYMDHSLQAIAFYLGLLRGGHTALILPADKPGLADTLTDTFQPDALYHPAKGLELLPAIARRAATGPVELAPELALMLATSGSTGDAKCVRLSYDNLAANAASIAEYLQLGPNERALQTLPLHYCYGLSVLHSHLSVGAQVILGLPSLADPSFMTILQENGVTSFAAVPYSFEILERLKLREAKLPTLKTITQAGGRLAPETVAKYAKWAQETGKSFIVMYGQTEATARMAYMPAEALIDHPDCFGRAVSGGTLSLCADDGTPVTKSHTPGNLIYEGPNVMMGYATARSHLAETGHQTRLETGDMAARNDAGFFYMVGRKKRIAKLYGVRVNLDALEQHLIRTGRPALALSDDQTLYLVSPQDAHTNTPFTPADTQALAREYGLSVKDIRITYLTDIPRRDSGKTDYPALLTLLQQDEAPLTEASKSRGSKDHSKRPDRLVQLYKTAFPDQTVTHTSSFNTLGGDSLTYVEVSLGIENCLGTLPANWESMPLDQLAAQAVTTGSTYQPGSKPFTHKPLSGRQIETSLLIRALAPILVVLNHSGLSFMAGGAAALLLISGYHFGRFSKQKLIDGETSSLLRSFFFHILIPYWIIVIGYQTIKGAAGLPDILLVSNLIGTSGKPPFEVWFIQALLQSFLIMIALALIPGVRRLLEAHTYIVSLFILGLAAAARLADEFAFNTLLNTSGRQITWVFWLFALGLLLSQTHSWQEKILSAFLLFICPVAFYSGDWSRILVISLCGLGLIWSSRLMVPALLIKPLGWLSASSLFIYMLHGRAPAHSVTSDWPVDIIRVLLGLLIGITAHLLYEALLKLIGQFLTARSARDLAKP